MSEFDAAAHWQAVYTAKGENEVSWFEQNPSHSLGLIARAKPPAGACIVDVGGGASRLVDALLRQENYHVTVVDLSAAALETARGRLPSNANAEWVVSDITKWQPEQIYDVWHDRAAFHFLTEAHDQRAYADVMAKALRPGARAIIGTFALSGPEKCSGLPVSRYDGPTLSTTLGSRFRLLESTSCEHLTPWGSSQRFQFSIFEKRAG